MRYLFIIILIFGFIKVNSGIQSNKELFESKNILITGGSGFLGKAIIEDLLRYNPNEIVVFSRDEHKQNELVKFFDNNPKIRCVLGDIRDFNSLLKNTKNIDFVIHAAALKCIDVLESNVEESIKTNVLGSLNLFAACEINNVKKAVFISTDKASSPVNAYGACKFLSEKIFNNYDRKRVKTAFMVVRYGNVLESTGSVIPFFIKKIKSNEDIPLTDINMTRFLITKEEAVDLIFSAMKYGVGGEIFLKHLEAMKIIDLIDVLKTKFNSNNKVSIVGIRPGEKIHETLINETEILRTFKFEDKYIIVPANKEWLLSLNEKNELPIYMSKKNINNNLIKEFNSNDVVVSKTYLQDYFDKYNFFYNV